MLGLYLFVEDQCKELYHNTYITFGEITCRKKVSDSLQKQNKYSTKMLKYTIILNYLQKDCFPSGRSGSRRGTYLDQTTNASF